MDPRVCGGEPVIRGTRRPVAVLLVQWAEGSSWQDVMRGYPELSEEGIRAVLRYASAAAHRTELAEVVSWWGMCLRLE